MYWQKKFITVLILLISIPVFAISSHTPVLQSGRWFIRGDVGIIWPETKDFMAVPNGSAFPPPMNVDQLTIIAANNQGQVALAGGYQWQRDASFFRALAIGLRYQHIFSKEYTGSIMQYSLAQYADNSYSWCIRNDVLSVYSKLNLWQYERLMPYAEGGIGITRNHSDNYIETAYAGLTPRVSPDYASGNENQFTYNVGLGLDFLITDNVTASIGYNYQFLGNVRSGRGKGIWSTSQLRIEDLSANNAYLSVSYLFDKL